MTTLNTNQQCAIHTHGQPLLIVAGAGSGKTTVITHKIADLIANNHFAPEHILAITFTNKAAAEMGTRLTKLIGTLPLQPTVKTFHGFCCLILRRDMVHLGRGRDFTIMDRGDQTDIIRRAMKTLNIDPKLTTPNAVIAQISKLKNEMVGPAAFDGSHANYDAQVAALYAAYEQALIAQNGVDFDDLLLLTVQLFEQHPDVLAHVQHQYRYILIDEYQDTNDCQYRLTKLLNGGRPDICVVGDFDQNIYTWRGANVNNILQFEKDFPGTVSIKLEQNYRSTGNILKAANSLIQHNTQRVDKNLWSEKGAGDKLTYYVANDERDEAAYLMKRLAKWVADGKPLREAAILFRTHAQSRVLEEACLRQGIAYKMVGGVRFYARKEVKDLLAYLRLIHQDADATAFARAVAMPPRGVGATSVAKITQVAEMLRLLLSQAIHSDRLKLSTKQRESLAQFFGVIEKARAMTDLAEMIRFVFRESGLKAAMEVEKTEEAASRIENIHELISLAQECSGDLGEFLNDVALMSDMDTIDETQDAVTLMTFHHAKGLEFDLVLMPGFEEGILPHYKSQHEAGGMEEERRLAYVGITRGREQVVMTSAAKRVLFGEVWVNAPSRFFFEVDPETVTVFSAGLLRLRRDSVLEHFDPSIYTIRSVEPSRPKEGLLGGSADPISIPEPIADLVMGDQVRHPEWGTGIVNSTSGNGDRLMANIAFGSGTKNVMVKYAPLVKV